MDADLGIRAIDIGQSTAEEPCVRTREEVGLEEDLGEEEEDNEQKLREEDCTRSATTGSERDRERHRQR